mgnify:CR=1 FL=1
MSMSRTLLGLQHCNLRQSKVGMGPHHGLSLDHQDSSTYLRISELPNFLPVGSAYIRDRDRDTEKTEAEV